jgi:hypothetical protein
MLSTSNNFCKKLLLPNSGNTGWSIEILLAHQIPQGDEPLLGGGSIAPSITTNDPMFEGGSSSFKSLDRCWCQRTGLLDRLGGNWATDDYKESEDRLGISSLQASPLFSHQSLSIDPKGFACLPHF